MPSQDRAGQSLRRPWSPWRTGAQAVDKLSRSPPTRRPTGDGSSRHLCCRQRGSGSSVCGRVSNSERILALGRMGCGEGIVPRPKCDLFALQRHRAYAVSSGHNEPLLPTGPFVKATFQPDISESERSHCQRIRFACMTSLDDCAKDPQLGAGLFMRFIYQDIRADREVRSAIPEYSRIVDACFNRR